VPVDKDWVNMSFNVASRKRCVTLRADRDTSIAAQIKPELSDWGLQKSTVRPNE
jgi:hypothetical protein